MLAVRGIVASELRGEHRRARALARVLDPVLANDAPFGVAQRQQPGERASQRLEQLFANHGRAHRTSSAPSARHTARRLAPSDDLPRAKIERALQVAAALMDSPPANPKCR